MTWEAPVGKFVPSALQERIFDFARTGRGSAVVEAVAGSGKSTTMVQLLPLLRGTVQMFAFNAPIAAELREKIKKLEERTGRELRGVRASTFHSVGFSAILKKLDRKPGDVTLDGGKVQKLARELLSEEDAERYGSFSAKLVAHAKGRGFGAIMPASLDDWRNIIEHHDLFLDDELASEDRAIEVARSLLRASNEAALAGSLDFDDQLYLPLLWRLSLWQNDVVIVDEAQDTNNVRRALARKCLKPSGRLFAVGDSRQAIYGFTGATNDALDLIAREFSATRLPLNVSYRCPRAVAAEARAFVPNFEAAAGAAEGAVLSSSLKDALARGLLGAEDAILCRNTAPLVSLAFVLIARGTGCTILGKDIGAGLAALVKKRKAKGIDQLIEKLEAFRDAEVEKLAAKGQDAKAESLKDRVTCVLTVIDHLEERTVPGLLKKIEGMFSEGGRLLQLGTVHKVKGKEYRNVAILRSDLMPSKFARQDWQFEQEKNLQYVAYTRPTNILVFLTTEEP